MTGAVCPTMSEGSGFITPLLGEVDCQITHYIEAAYGSLFGPFGAMQPLLTSALTIYVAFYGFQLMTGRGSVSLAGLAPKVLAIGLVLAFATRWGAYQAFFVNLVYGGADQLAALMVDGARKSAGGPSAAGVLARLDLLLENVARIAATWNDGAIAGAAAAPPPPAAPDVAMEQNGSIPFSKGAASLLWLSVVLLALSTVGTLIITKILLGLLLAIGPLLVVAALFSTTRGLFEGWLRALALYALAPALTMAATGALLRVIEPMAVNIQQLRAIGDPSPQPVFIFAFTIVIFVLLIVQLLRMCLHLTGAWKLPIGQSAPSRSAADGAPSASPAMQPAGAGGRVAEIVTTIQRGDAYAGDRRSRDAAGAVTVAPQEREAPASLLSRRNGQRYRMFGEQRVRGARFA